MFRRRGGGGVDTQLYGAGAFLLAASEVAKLSKVP